ncbi:ArgS-related anticodon-binding protein NrtL [Streptomyces sp. NPDC058371]|uniref:ArgS-related anticodon-binding protein NrtL n=1 Tax=Streptomyces sp. NPDC058371 TaxID=3346463 RepID=UPI003664A41C
MTPSELSRTVLRAVRRAVDAGELSVAVPARAVVSVPGPGGRGDYATTIALQLARPSGRPPLQVAEILRPHLACTDGVADVEITGPGFLNIHLDGRADTAARLVREIQSGSYGHSDALAGQVVRLRIPYDIRAEVVADSLVRIIATQGGRTEVEHMHMYMSGAGRETVRAGEPEPIALRPVPAPEDPTPLGPDAARWALLHPAAHDRPRITADHLVQRAVNPLFRVRYAHARTRALARNAADLGFQSAPGDVRATAAHEPHPGDVQAPPTPEPHPGDVQAPPTPEPHPGDVQAPPTREPVAPVEDLLRALADHPRALRAAAVHRAPDRVARQLVAVADALLGFQHTVLPLGDEKPSAAHRARLALAEASGTVLAGGLSLLGISAPDYL